MVKAKPVCSLDDIPLDDDRLGQGAFKIKIERQKVFVLAIRRGDDVYLYKNSCPHLGSPLDLDNGKFLNPERSLIICSTHGALFEIESGSCISGPCVGKTLEAVACRVEGGHVWLD